MVKKKTIDKEALMAELDLHKTEFSALRSEILQLMDSERQYLNLSIVAFGAGLGLAPYISAQESYVVLLLFPLVFHVLLWEMLKSIQAIEYIADYLMQILVPRVNEILKELGSDEKDVVALGWEKHSTSKRLVKGPAFLTASLTPTRHWVPVLAVGAFLIAYALTIRNAGYFPSRGELVLMFLNLALLVWAALQNFFTSRAAAKNAN
ncbi:MAG: hypothetical protein GY755_08910 [Chloroflexi bacterium]|nr:hypothetical protein [Chloroflexota bacterium]